MLLQYPNTQLVVGSDKAETICLSWSFRHPHISKIWCHHYHHIVVIPVNYNCISKSQYTDSKLTLHQVHYNCISKSQYTDSKLPLHQVHYNCISISQYTDSKLPLHQVHYNCISKVSILIVNYHYIRYTTITLVKVSILIVNYHHVRYTTITLVEVSILIVNYHHIRLLHSTSHTIGFDCKLRACTNLDYNSRYTSHMQNPQTHQAILNPAVQQLEKIMHSKFITLIYPQGWCTPV